MKTLLNVAAYQPCTIVEGPGKRFALWVQGCLKRCPGCCNEEMLPIMPNQLVSTAKVKEKIDESICNHKIEGITLLGGEPFLQAQGLYEIAKHCKDKGLSVMVFSGYTLRELEKLNFTMWRELYSCIDLLVDGPYIATKPEVTRKWIGSTNQKLHYLSDFYEPGIEQLEDNVQQKIEVNINNEKAIINGWPVLYNSLKVDLE